MSRAHDLLTRTLDEQLRFTGLNAVDKAIGDEIWSIVSPRIDKILDGFYVQLKEFSDASDFARMDLERLTRAQIKHWERLFSFDFCPDYVESVLRVGTTHDRIGLEAEWYVAGYVYLLNQMTRAIFDHHAKDPAKAHELALALNEAVGLDMGIALSVYQSDHF